MKWGKLGRVYVPDGSMWWAKSHAMIPTPEILDDGRIRVYVSMCDAEGRGRPGYVDVSTNDPTRVLKVSREPLLDIGAPGTFDDNGAVVTSIVRLPDGTRYMYYVGFEILTKIRYRLFTGLAIQPPGEPCFTRYSQAPILDRTDQEIFFRCGPYVRYDGSGFHMWYVAGSEWTNIGGKPMPVYDIRYLQSDDGIRWDGEGKVLIRVSDADEHGFGRPYIVENCSVKRMFYSVRSISRHAYKLGYAESSDGEVWTRKDHDLGFESSHDDWDNEAQSYAAVVTLNGNEYMFYNGNGFGESGFGVAVREE